jgi:YD repeat-containing protein
MAYRLPAGLIASSLIWPVAAQAAETVSYNYDARGRLVQVVHTGSVNNGVTTQYNRDKADNRSKVKTTGAP